MQIISGGHTGVRISPAAPEPPPQHGQRHHQSTDPVDDEHGQAHDVAGEPAKILAEEACDERQRQEEVARMVSCSMVAFCRLLFLACSTESTAMFASDLCLRRVRR